MFLPAVAKNKLKLVSTHKYAGEWEFFLPDTFVINPSSSALELLQHFHSCFSNIAGNTAELYFLDSNGLKHTEKWKADLTLRDWIESFNGQKIVYLRIIFDLHGLYLENDKYAGNFIFPEAITWTIILDDRSEEITGAAERYSHWLTVYPLAIFDDINYYLPDVNTDININDYLVRNINSFNHSFNSYCSVIGAELESCGSDIDRIEISVSGLRYSK